MPASPASFDAWFHGSPRVYGNPENPTGQMDYWFHGAIYLNPLTKVVLVGLQMRAKIVHPPVTHPIQMRTRVRNKSVYTVNMKGRVFQHVSKSLQMRARVRNMYTDTLSMTAKIIHKNATTLSMRADIRNRVTHTVQMKAKIGAGTQTHTLQMKAKIIHFTYTMSMKADIKKHLTETYRAKARIAPSISMRTRISRRQGWPIPSTADPAIASFVPTQLSLKAKVKGASRGTASFDVRAKMFKGGLYHMQMRSKLSTGQSLQMKASIFGTKSSSTDATYLIVGVTNVTLDATYYVLGGYALKALQMKAKILGVFNFEAYGEYAIVCPPLIVGSVQTLNGASYNVEAVQTLLMKALIGVG